MELADYEAAVQAFEKSRFAIDAEHKSVMADVLDGEVEVLSAMVGDKLSPRATARSRPPTNKTEARV
jgi:hypothetical protein